ncbi:Smr/MutS family protein [Oceaniglobus ichthyenteri]|uniref:Smr/MutS family protein n=1 Tax=Oceaniglobus ichthyenteri TaxID=2136177 RepID=UPI000D33A795|nr:Smr/MutS family protein [Oceaniglobus ichthyenteri]
MSRRREPRRLNPDEAELWQRVVEHAVPMHPARAPDAPAPVPQPAAPPKKPVPPPIAPFAIKGSRSEPRVKTDTAPPLSQQVSQGPLAMDHKAFTKMRRGKLPVEGRIDLHGMTLDQAQPTLINYIMGSQAMGKRLVLVITGKGGRKRDRNEWHNGHGALKRQVPHWLRMAPVGAKVLQVSEAHQSHGGSGAYYVYLRRNR